MPDRKELQAARLFFLRGALGFEEQQQFAKELGVAKNTYNAMETGKRQISPNVAFRMREKYGIPLDFTFYGDDRWLPADIKMQIRRRA